MHSKLSWEECSLSGASGLGLYSAIILHLNKGKTLLCVHHWLCCPDQCYCLSTFIFSVFVL